MAMDQVPEPLTVAVLPPARVAPLSSVRVMVEPASPVPVTLKPAVFSATLISSSPAITAIVVTPAIPPDVYAVKPVLFVLSRENELASTLVIV